ncbi:MAG TPA: alpha/beta fold hydrolase [Candidatus Limnocylindrales bacterium]|nr:alpha/beta fold hydrolase [Candidatus Limnocylindrales bacterium]
MARDIHPPSPLLLLGEAFSGLEFPRMLLRLPWLATAPRGHGEPVLVLPGYGASDTSTLLLQTYLRFLGYSVRGWGLGMNRGDVPRTMPRVLSLIEKMHDESGERVHLVGWSLGGFIAREAARENPELVRSVITLGSPVIGGPKYTAVARRYKARGFDLDAVEAEVDARYERPLCVPITAIYSKFDGIVAWKACIDERSQGIEHIEVLTTHLGLGICADVYTIIADRLARARDEAAACAAA